MNSNRATWFSAEPVGAGSWRSYARGDFATGLEDYAAVGLDPVGVITSWTTGAERIAGYAREEIIGEHFSVLYPPDQVEAGKPGEVLAQAAEAGSCTVEGWRVRKDGSWFWASVVIVALRSADGSLGGFTKLTWDETESRARQERANRRFDDLFGFTPVGLALVSSSGSVVEANDALAALLGYERDQLQGMRAAELLHPQDRIAGLVSGTAHVQGPDIAYRLLARADRHPVYCQLRSAPSVQDDGSVFRVVAFQPVTERLREAEALRNQATDDYLTRLPHGRGVNELLGHLLASADDAPARGEPQEGYGTAFHRINTSFGVSLASPLLIAGAARQVQAQHQLREALAHDGLALRYQPQVTADGSVVSAEELVRWPHPERGLLGPDKFLPVAQQGGFLADLDRWVLRTALCEAASWPTAGEQQVSIAVNLSGLTPDDPDFADTIARIVAESGIDPHRVILELVETALVDLPVRSQQAMSALTARGVRFAVDDFGTGHSSLARLRDLPVQIIKTDRRFVAGLGRSPADLALAKAIADMARALDRQCVAEGVETTTQFQILSGLGIDTYQGWLFSGAVPADQFRTLLGNRFLEPTSTLDEATPWHLK